MDVKTLTRARNCAIAKTAGFLVAFAVLIVLSFMVRWTAIPITAMSVYLLLVSRENPRLSAYEIAWPTSACMALASLVFLVGIDPEKALQSPPIATNIIVLLCTGVIAVVGVFCLLMLRDFVAKVFTVFLKRCTEEDRCAGSDTASAIGS